MTEDEYLKTLDMLKKEFDRRTQELRQVFAITNCKYKVGDIIANKNNLIIRVEKIYGSTIYSKIPIICYYGPRLTLKLQPRKDGCKMQLSELQVERLL